MTCPARILVTILLGLLLVPASPACTTFVVTDGEAILFARNLDWPWTDGLMMVNPRGLKKTAIVRPPETPAKWIANYGSVTFNQCGREMPFGGMNEAGLVIEQMMLYETRFPKPDERPVVNMLQWAQYQLDRCRTVDEVIASDQDVRIEVPEGSERIHYLVCDATGQAATIEFLDGKLVCHRGGQLPVRALTNDNYRKSLVFARRYQGASPSGELPGGSDSLPRFARAARCVQQFRSRSPRLDREYCFHHLREVAQGDATVWSVVYDIPGRTIYFRTHGHEEVRWASFSDLDFAPSRPPLALDVNAPNEGRLVEGFQPLTEAWHRRYLLGFLGKPDVQQMLGDQTQFAEKLFETLRGYEPVDVVVSPR